MDFVQPIRNKKEIEAMKKVLKEKSERNFIMFMIGINAGLRISDILTLKVRDVRGNHLNIIEQKTQKKKRIAINNSLKDALSDYIRNKNNNEYLIKSRVGVNKPITRSQAYNILREAAEKCGLEEVGTHTMRKTFAYHMYQQTKDVAVLQRILNHRDPFVTLRYLGIEQDYQDTLVMQNNL